MNILVPISSENRISVQATTEQKTSISINTSKVYISEVNVLASAVMDDRYYPRNNPSGYSAGMDGSSFVTRDETGNFYTRNEILKFSVSLNSGIDSQYISYPNTLAQKPTTITCQMENNVDFFIYLSSISSVTSSGFYSNFSDFLSSAGYKLNVTVHV